MYKKTSELLLKQKVDCQNMTSWEKLNDDERYFIKMIIAFFAASDDGIV